VTGRSLGWAALVAAVAAITVLVPPLVAPKSHSRAGTAAPSPSVSASVLVLPSASPLPSASLSPSSVSSPEPTMSAPPTPTKRPFKTIRLLAADKANVRSGARVIECAGCQGGHRVGYIGGPNTLIMLIHGVTAPGRRTLTVTYETDVPRTLKIAVNQNPVRTLKLAGAKDFMIPAVTRLTISLPAGSSSIKFFNDEGPAPDINGIVIS